MVVSYYHTIYDTVPVPVAYVLYCTSYSSVGRENRGAIPMQFATACHVEVEHLRLQQRCCGGAARDAAA